MSVVIFCGGKGTRLKEETEFKPKPLVTVGGVPILHHIMNIYAHFGYKKFVLCLGYRGNAIKDYFLNYKLFSTDFSLKDGKVKYLKSGNKSDDFDITFVDTGEDTLTGERLMMVKEYIDDDFMLTYGDAVAKIDIEKLVELHGKNGLTGTVTGVHPTSKFGLLAVNDKQVVTSFYQKPLLHDYVNGGFMVFKSKFFDYLKPNQMIEDAMKDLVEDEQMAMYKHDGFWHCMDTYKDYEDLNVLHANGAPWVFDGSHIAVEHYVGL